MKIILSQGKEDFELVLCELFINSVSHYLPQILKPQLFILTFHNIHPFFYITFLLILQFRYQAAKRPTLLQWPLQPSTRFHRLGDRWRSCQVLLLYWNCNNNGVGFYPGRCQRWQMAYSYSQIRRKSESCVDIHPPLPSTSIPPPNAPPRFPPLVTSNSGVVIQISEAVRSWQNSACLLDLSSFVVIIACLHVNMLTGCL